MPAVPSPEVALSITLAVCGGRELDDWALVREAMDSIHDSHTIDKLISGGCRGADKLAEDWAHLNLVDTDVYEANFAQHGKSAGPRRNQEMLDLGKPDMLLAFPGGRGTADMVRRSIKSGIPVAIVDGASATIVFLEATKRDA